MEEARAYGLEERTFAFAKEVRAFVRGLPRTLCNLEDARQLVRSSGSVGANFIEAAESISAKDFTFRIRISRKEAKESRATGCSCSICRRKHRKPNAGL